jgi:signal peptidase II
LLALVICLFSDLISKNWAHAHLQPGVSQIFLPGFVNLTLTSNTGFAFSIGRGHKALAQIIAAIVYLTLLVVYWQRYFSGNVQRAWIEQLGMSIILGAALGNLSERLSHGTVTDFFEFAFINFPIFNVADVLIDVGIGFILISPYFYKKKSPVIFQE